MEILFLFVGLVFVGVGLLIIASETRNRRGAVEVRGSVIGFSTSANSEGEASLHAVAEYPGPDGRRRYVEAAVGSASPLNAVGEPITVLIRPDDPDKAIVKSSLTYVLAAIIASMGLASCAAFFAFFRFDAFSVLGAVAVVILGAWKLRGAIRDKPGALKAWVEARRSFAPRTYTDETRNQIRWVDPSALRNAIDKQKKMSRIASPILVVLGAGVLFLGAHLHRRTEEFLARAVGGTGTVVGLVESSSSDSTTYAPLVEFEHDGKTYKFKDSIGSNPPSYRSGDVVAVLYDPSQPADARIDRGRWNKLIPDLIGGFGALLGFLGIWMALKRPRERITMEMPAPD
jgi:Sec-independent protein translocase protein TatA